MKKTSTPTRDLNPTQCQSSKRTERPSRATLDFIRQFARNYQAVPSNLNAGLPGYSLS